ncbi:MAG: glutathione peroxidase [Planctomycetes bacterium]|nr:glutathione peroxidase [Planctomycetota bacterium]
MFRRLVMLVAVAALACGLYAEEKTVAASPLSFTLKANDGSDHALSQYKGKVVLLVNVASRCGLTPQYTQLQALYEKYKDRGLVVVGIPCNDFGAQEPGTNEEIKKFCSTKFNVTFPLMSKVHVQGAEIDPLYQYLTVDGPKPGKITWNFEKFLVARDGSLAERFAPRTKPDAEDVVKAIETELDKK